MIDICQDTVLNDIGILSVAMRELESTLNNNQFFQGGLILGILAWLGMQFREVPIKIYYYLRRFVYYTVTISEVEDAIMFFYFSKWMTTKYPNKFRNTIATFTDTMNDKYIKNRAGNRILDEDSDDTCGDIDSKNKYTVSLQQSSDISYIWKGFNLIRIESIREKLEGAMNVNQGKYLEYKISGWFSKNKILDILKELSETRENDERDSRHVSVRTAGSSGYYDEYKVETFKTFDDIFFKERDSVIRYLDVFKKNRTIYKKHGITYKTGIMLYGPPGTGKSKTAVAIADYLGFGLTTVNISALSSEDALNNAVSGFRKNSVVLFEDIDDSYGGTNRGNLEGNKNNVSFGSMLQLLDGVVSPDGVIFIFTTNNPDSLDPALYREGRINLKIELTYPRICDLRDYLSSYFDMNLGIEELIESVTDGTCNSESLLPYTLATAESLCISGIDILSVFENLKRLWNESKLRS